MKVSRFARCFFQSEAMVSYIINSKEEGELLAESALNQAPAWLLPQFSIFVGFPHWSLVSLFSSHLGFLHWSLVYLLCSFHFPFPIAVWFLCFLPILRPAGPPDRSEGWHISWKGFGDLGKGIQFVEGSTGSHQSVQACAIGYFENPTNARKKWWPCNFIELILAWLVIDVQWAKPSCYCHVLLLAIDVIWGFLQYTVHWVAWLHSTSTDLIAFNFPLIVQTNRLTVQLLVTGFFFLECFVSFVFLFWKGLFLLARLCFDDVDPVALHTATCQHFQKLPKTRWCQSSALSNFAAFVSYWFAVRNLAGKWQTGLGRLKVGFSGCHWSLAVTILIAMAIHPHRVAPAILHRAHHQQLVHLKGLNGKWFLF